MQSVKYLSNNSEFHTLHLRGSTHVPVEIKASKVDKIITMVTRFDTKLHSLAEELTEVRGLLDEANKALADAGIPFHQGNIRERISAYQVFRKVMTFPV